MTIFTESTIEQAALDWIETLKVFSVVETHKRWRVTKFVPLQILAGDL